MLLFLLRRLLLALPALWLMGTLVFLLSRMLPGSFAEERFLNSEAGFYTKGSHSSRNAAYSAFQRKTQQDLPLFYFSLHTFETAAEIKGKRVQPEPLLLPNLTWNGINNQYHLWLTKLLHGNLGTSYRTGQPVQGMIWKSIGNTFWLLLSSMLVTLILALELSMLMVRGQLQWLKRLMMPLLFLLDSVPTLVLALLLLVLFANPDFLQLFPVFGMGYYVPQHLNLWQQLTLQMQYMALPMAALVLVNLPYITNHIYGSLRASLHADYTRTARAKGLPEYLVIRRHALRNALLPLITIISDFLPALVSGSILVETIYAIPGIGRLLIDSVLARDYPVLVAIILIVLSVRIVAYALADTAYGLADPRIRQKIA